MPLTGYFILSTNTIPGSFAIPVLVLKIFTYSLFAYKFSLCLKQVMLHLKGITNSIDFYKGIFLHVITCQKLIQKDKVHIDCEKGAQISDLANKIVTK